MYIYIYTSLCYRLEVDVFRFVYLDLIQHKKHMCLNMNIQLHRCRLYSQGKCGYPSESTLAVCSINIPPYALYNLYIVGRWWYKVRVPPEGYPPFPFDLLFVGNCAALSLKYMAEG